MTRVDDKDFVGEEGVGFMILLCSKSRVIFRPLRVFDVGIDGFIEPQVFGKASGALIGVQLKSGTSTRLKKPGTYSFPGDRAHFEYWARCRIPIIGVVYDTELERALWTNLSVEATSDRIANGPYNIQLSLEKNELTRDSLAALIASAEDHRVTGEVRARSQARKGTLEEDQFLRERSWDELLEIFLSTIYEDWEVASAGQRLSRYFPTLNERQREYTIDRINEMNAMQIAKVIRAMATVMEDNADPIAEQLCNLLGHLKDAPGRVESVLRAGAVPLEATWAGIQAIEMLQQDERADLWAWHDTLVSADAAGT